MGIKDALKKLKPQKQSCCSVEIEENRNEDINQSTNAKENERVEKQDPNTNDEVERPSKKGFWSRLFGN